MANDGELKQKLDAIKAEKDEFLIPENIKAGVTILGVTGTVEGIKQFTTVEEMQADTSAQDGDLAIVYSSEPGGDITADSRFTKLEFLKTTGAVSTAIFRQFSIRSTNGSVYATGNTAKEIMIMGPDWNVDISYGGSQIDNIYTDGIEYEETDDAYIFDFGTECYTTYPASMNKLCRLPNVNVFGGLFQYDGTEYTIAPSQFTLNTANQLPSGLIGYGSNGVMTGTLGEEIGPELDTVAEQMFMTLKQKYMTMDKVVLTNDTVQKYASSNIIYMPNCLDISNLTTMYGMFINCKHLIEVDLGGLDTSNITDLTALFESCEKLARVNLSGFNTSNVTSLQGLVASCSELVELDLSSFDTSKVENLRFTFHGCNKLEKLDISNFTFDAVTDYSAAFANMNTSCLILVKDQTAKDWITSKFTDLTNVQIKSEYIANQSGEDVEDDLIIGDGGNED